MFYILCLGNKFSDKWVVALHSCTQCSLIQPSEVLNYKVLGKEWTVWRELSFLMEILRYCPRSDSSLYLCTEYTNLQSSFFSRKQSYSASFHRRRLTDWSVEHFWNTFNSNLARKETQVQVWFMTELPNLEARRGEPAIHTSESYLQVLITKSIRFSHDSADPEFWAETPETSTVPVIYNRGTLTGGNSWMPGWLPAQDHMLIHSRFLFSKRPYLILLPGR